MNRVKWSARPGGLGLSAASALTLALALGAAPVSGLAKEKAAAPAKEARGVPATPSRLNGKLANGLAYHIERVGDAGGETNFRLIVRVGHLHSFPERQVAHIVEHIVVEKLADKAAKGSVWDRASRIGARVNAGTGETSTSYYVDLPASNPDATAEGLAILLDWANAGPLSDEEIDRERKAVIEEGRQGGYGEENRLSDARIAAIFPDNERLSRPREPIGTSSATAPTMRHLYRTYYVPSNMGVIIVGDIDPAATLRAITARLGSLPAGAAPRGASSDKKPSLAGGHYTPMARKESDETNLALIYKIPPAGTDTKIRARDEAILKVVEPLTRDAFAAIAERRERIMRGGLTFTKGPVSLGGPGADYLTLGAALGRRTARDALADTLLLAEALRLRGFPAADIERAKAELLKAPDTTSLVQDIAGRWAGYYAEGAFAPDSADIRGAIAGLSAADINDALRAWLDPAHRDIFVLYPEADAATIPTAADVAGFVTAAERSAPIDFTRPQPRELHLAVAPVEVGAAGPPPEPAREAKNYLRWTLPRSGATLLYRREEGGKVSLLMRRLGGAARFDPRFAMSARAIPEIVAASGMGGLSGPEFARYLSERKLRLSVSAAPTYEQFTAAGPADEWPLLLGLVRERMTRPECSDKAFQTYLEGARDALAIKGEVGDVDALARIVDDRLGGKWRPDAADLDAMNLSAMCDRYRTMFGDSAGMTIVVEGDLDPAQAYAGAIAALDRPAAAARAPVKPRTAPETAAGRTVLRRGSKPTARVTLAIAANTHAPFASVMTEPLQLAVFRRLRSEEKGTYAPYSGMSGDTTPGRALMSIAFECAPENVDRLIAAAKDEVDKLGRAGPGDADIATWRTELAKNTGDAGAIAEAWAAKGTLAADPQASDAEIKSWVRDFFRSSRLYEFVQLPAE